MSPKVNILFPIEIMNRELDARLYQACLTARPGNRIFIGQSDAIYRVVKYTRGGLYVGKNIFMRIFPGTHEQLNRYRVLKENGFSFMHLDEEGGVMAGDENRWRDWLNKRLDVSVLSADDNISTWGNWQNAHYKSLHPSCEHNIVTTGHPRFDLYKKENRKYFEGEANRIKERYGGFILINTNFAWANHHKNLAGPFSKRWNYDPTNPPKRLDHIRQWGFTWRVLSGMVELVTRLSVEMPQLNFVIRPHPSENFAFYEAIFENVTNVHVMHEGSVGAWLLASKAMIHDGCTTAIEAHFSDVPIINYKSVQDKRYDLMLPNLLGTQCATQDEVIAEIHRVLASPSREAAIKPLNDDVKTTTTNLIHNFRHNAGELLTNRIWEVSDKLAPSQMDFKLAAFNTYSRVQPAWLSVKHRIKPPKEKEGHLHKFLGWTQSQMLQKLERAQEITNRDVKCTVHSEEVLSIEC